MRDQRSIEISTAKVIFYILLAIFYVGLYIISPYLVGFMVYYQVLQFLLKASGRKIWLTWYLSYGESMRPVLPPGVKLIFTVYPYNVSEGDIILYEKGGLIIEHRVISKKDADTFVVEGEYNSETDIISRSDIQAKHICLFSHPLYIPISPASIQYFFK